ncbi:MAG: glycosyltransferase N-terminal domain-containing protein, partial [Candidatus Sumerlaeia bacterium]|nr:glycosyltransferase N-terminal domain-containing protein [Candidatus Sumerlaeia bacterium]
MAFRNPVLPLALDAVYTAAAPFVWRKMKKKERLRGTSPERADQFFTRHLGKDVPPVGTPEDIRCWLHAVSVGESVAAGALFRQLKNQRPQWDYLVTTTTETGQKQARESLKTADRFAYAPYDHGICVRRFLHHYRPSLYCFFETEFWPNLLLELGRRQTPVFLVNGKLSEKSAKAYARFRFLFRPPLLTPTRYFMQTDDDAERLRTIIGAHPGIRVSGNLKFDALPNPISPEERLEWRTRWGIKPDELLFTAGSTHPTEEALMLRAFAEARQRVPNLRLMLVPRHPERFSEVAELITSAGHP